MYLSKVTFEKDEKQYDCQKAHRTIMRLFNASRSDAGVLYRLDKKSDMLIAAENETGDCRAGLLKAIVLSKKKPQIPDYKYNIMINSVHEFTPFLACFTDNREYKFELSASASKKQREQNQKNSVRRLLETKEERFEWLQRKGEQHGFMITNASELYLLKYFGVHRRERGGAMFVRGVRFSGTLKIVDSGKFINAVVNGVGQEAAYGFGMLYLPEVMN